MGKEKFKVLEGVFDEHTLSTLDILKRKKYFDELGHAIKTGKEGDVYFARKFDKEQDGRRAIKMYRVTSANFKKISQYITRDYRFKTIKGNLRKVIMAWSQKEFRNLNLCHKAQMNVPYPYIQMNNVIVMQYIDGGMLKDIYLEDPEDFFEQLLEQLYIMRHEAKLVHGDLSEYNIMVQDQTPYIIDVGQAMSIKNEDDFNSFKDLYERDIKVVVNFFNRKYNLDLKLEEVLERLEG
ncbi:MAG: RIO1 family regulatory kinase/ATPase [Nanoarchaeota archaeon]|nr:RIO1 family regulatory kinase/ATPase [Nanoarchaeota archaeon]